MIAIIGFVTTTVLTGAILLYCLKNHRPVENRRIELAQVIAGTFIGGTMGTLLQSFEFPLGTFTKVQGMPIPGALFRLEEGQWVDFICPVPILVIALNILVFCLAGAMIVELWRRWRGRLPNTAVQRTR